MDPVRQRKIRPTSDRRHTQAESRGKIGHFRAYSAKADDAHAAAVERSNQRAVFDDVLRPLTGDLMPDGGMQLARKRQGDRHDVLSHCTSANTSSGRQHDLAVDQFRIQQVTDADGGTLDPAKTQSARECLSPDDRRKHDVRLRQQSMDLLIVPGVKKGMSREGLT